MKRRTIDSSRELRLWIGQIIIPALTLGVTAMGVPEIRHSVAESAKNAKESIKSKFQKKES